MVLKRPVGPALLITPWNFPLAMATRKIGPAIAAGCTSILKPAALTPLTSLLFAKVLEDVGVPAGVLLRDASEQVLRTSMELGGNAPFLVFEDADVDKAVDGAMLAKLRNMGEACTAANRFIVHESVAEEFSTMLAERFGSLKVSRGVSDGANIGPLIDQKSRQAVHALVEDAKAKGAKVLLGGEVPDGPGYFYPPTVLASVPESCEILSNEIFGPVAPICTFKTEDEAVAMANNTEYGLVAYAFTKDLNRGLRLAERLETGMFGLNTGLVSNPAGPFGGVKQSGLGREGSLEGIEEYLETVYVGIADPSL